MENIELVTKVLMPRLSLTMKEGTVVQWFKKEGETVNKGEPLVEVLTEKVTYDIEAPESGILRKILALEGVDVPVAEVLGVITAPDEQITEEITAPTPEKEVEKIEECILASPAAKRLAKEYGIDLAQVKGSGPEGRIVEEDVKKFAEESKIGPRVREIIPLAGIRKTAAERVTLSAKTAPHSTITMEVDMTNAARLREEKQVSYTDILVKSVAKALAEHRIVNSTLSGERIKIFEDINIGVAVATEKGLVVPVIHNANKKSLKEVATALNALVEKARASKLSKEELTGGTFTITNLGMFGVEIFTPIINPPETAILGVGKVVEKPVVVNKEIAVKPMMYLSLSYDHRVIDGAPAAQFLQKVKQYLENPHLLTYL
jgi:pyruvate dehydrogenase E2 component (dihydrolipoamide acetyltransferase)